MQIQLSNNYDDAKNYPQLKWCWTQKFDGICVITTPDGPRTRSGKQINNPYLRDYLAELPPGLIGEVCWNDISDKDSFKRAVSLVMTKKISLEEHTQLFRYSSFKIFNYQSDGGYAERLSKAAQLIEDSLEAFASVVTINYIDRLEEAPRIAAEVLGEGIIVTDSEGLYYEGRCPYSLKLKKMSDVDGQIVGYELEKYGHNLKNVPEELWGTDKEQVSKLKVETADYGVISAGTGLTLAQKKAIFNNPQEYLGKTVTIEFMECGSDKKPRQPRLKTFCREDL